MAATKCPVCHAVVNAREVRTGALRDRLAALAHERTGLEEQLQATRKATGAALLEVREAADLTLTEAASILGLSKPTVYLLLGDAEGAS